jgi:uncharacterized protein YegL
MIEKKHTVSRLPVYILIDTSGSMAGLPIEQVVSHLRLLVDCLFCTPTTFDTVSLCLVTFGSTAKIELPLSSLDTFIVPSHLDASGATSLGEALRLLCRTRAADLNRKSATSSGDWRPMVFLLSDGEPTDDFDAGLAEFKRQRWGVRIACALNNASEDNLRRFLDNVGAAPDTPDETANLVRISTSDAMQMQAFTKWVVEVINTVSYSQDPDGMAGQALPPLAPGVRVEKASVPTQRRCTIGWWRGCCWACLLGSSVVWLVLHILSRP